MSKPCVALVSRDPAARLALAAAFDGAPPGWRIELHDTPPHGADAVVRGTDASGAGIRFDPDRPAQVIEDVRRAFGPPSARVLLVTAPGGGTGATTVALHVALSLAPRRSTCFLDLDAGRSCAASLGMPEGARTWADDIPSQAEPGPAALPVPGGFKVLLAPSADAGVDPARALELAASGFERVVADVPRTHLNDAVIGCAHAGIAVVPPTIPAVKRARVLVDACGDLPLAVVTNRLGPGGESTRGALQRALGRRIALELPCCPALRDLEDDGRLLDRPWSRWRRAVGRLARALEAP
jgi:hypothetical protein